MGGLNYSEFLLAVLLGLRSLRRLQLQFFLEFESCSFEFAELLVFGLQLFAVRQLQLIEELDPQHVLVKFR